MCFLTFLRIPEDFVRGRANIDLFLLIYSVWCLKNIKIFKKHGLQDSFSSDAYLYVSLLTLEGKAVFKNGNLFSKL